MGFTSGCLIALSATRQHCQKPAARTARPAGAAEAVPLQAERLQLVAVQTCWPRAWPPSLHEEPQTVAQNGRLATEPCRGANRCSMQTQS